MKKVLLLLFALFLPIFAHAAPAQITGEAYNMYGQRLPTTPVLCVDLTGAYVGCGGSGGGGAITAAASSFSIGWSSEVTSILTDLNKFTFSSFGVNVDWSTSSQAHADMTSAMPCAVTTAAPTYTTGTTQPVSCTTAGGTRTDDASINGVTKAVGAGASNTGTPRVILSTDSAVTPIAVTPVAATAHAITTGGTAVTFVTGPVKGCYITNPLTLTDENIGAAEPLYVNPVTTATTSSLNGSSVALAPGQSFYCPAGQTTNISANALTSSHNAVVVVW